MPSLHLIEEPTACETCPLQATSLCRVLSEGDVGRVKSARGRQVSLRAKRLLVREGESTSEVFRLRSGWGIRYRTVASGERQILSFDLPGDFLTPELLCGEPARFSKMALTAMTLCAFPREPTANTVFGDSQKTNFIEKLLVRRVRDAEDRIMMLGRLSAAGRIAGLVLDTFRRLSRRGMTDGKEIEFPLRHEDLADALGMTPEHVSRTLAALRSGGLLEIRAGRAAVLDREGLHRLAS